MKKHILILSILLPTVLLAQTKTEGMVATKDHEPLIGATVRFLNESGGSITDIDGKFSLIGVSDQLIVSYVGFITDTVQVTSGMMHIMLAENAGELDAVVVSSGPTFYDNLDPKFNEIITEKELLKAACCNLSESFETNASVDVSLTDAVSGAKMIRMLGLDGRYVQINRENLPNVRGLTGRYGLGFVPGTWIQSIDVGKGAGTVVNGYESMTGQINLELKKPENSETLYTNGYFNSFGRSEINLNHARNLSSKVCGAVLAHANNFSNDIDRNNDGFMDLPKSRQFNVLNRYKYEGDRIMSQLGINIMRDEKAGGQTGFGFGDDLLASTQYGFLNNTSKAEVYGKTGILFPHKPFKGWGFIYSGSVQKMEGGFGRDLYSGDETTLYGNAIHQNMIGNSLHQFKTGVSFLFDQFDEFYVDSTYQRKETVPGVFYEYSYLPGDQFSLVAGMRYDRHNLFGDYFTPRLHLRFQTQNETVFRVSGGRGYRTPNFFMDNTQVLVSSRTIHTPTELKPEISWNTGVSMTKPISIGGKKLNLVADYFYTYFENQVYLDMDVFHTEVFIRYLDNRSRTEAFQVQLDGMISENISFKTAYKNYNTIIELNGESQAMPFVPRHRFFANMAYATRYEKWKVDGTLQWRGKSRFPNMSDYHGPARTFENQTPAYFLLNGQISRGFRWGNIYLGGENLLNFKQANPIVDPENPFDEHFDASMVWGPIAGRMVYAGFRYKIKRQ